MTDKDFEKLVFGMAHQIRNPCAIIKSNANLLLQNSAIDPNASHSLEAIVNGVRYLEERLDEFVEFSKPLHLDLRPASVEKLFQEVVSMVKEKCHLQKTKISYTLEDKIFLNRIDHHQIFLALLNVVLNAMESINEGGKILLKGESRNPNVLITVEDAGCGIHPRDLPEVFSPFYSTKKGGIGIGLAVTKRIIDAHNGKIEVKSEQGKGTLITIRLPTS